MTEVLLCLVCAIMVGWVLLLMSENQALKSDITKLKHQLCEKLDDTRHQVTIGRGRKLTQAELNRINQSPRRH